MLATLTHLVPQPIKDVILAPIAARDNPDRAAERLIRASMRIMIAVIGIFSAYKLLGILPCSFSGMAASVALPTAVVYMASMSSGDMMYGFTFLSFGTIGLITTLGLEAFTLLAISSNLLMSGMCVWIMCLGVYCIHASDERRAGFIGYLEPHITSIAENYRTSVANALFRR